MNIELECQMIKKPEKYITIPTEWGFGLIKVLDDQTNREALERAMDFTLEVMTSQIKLLFDDGLGITVPSVRWQ